MLVLQIYFGTSPKLYSKVKLKTYTILWHRTPPAQTKVRPETVDLNTGIGIAIFIRLNKIITKYKSEFVFTGYMSELLDVFKNTSSVIEIINVFQSTVFLIIYAHDVRRTEIGAHRKMYL